MGSFSLAHRALVVVLILLLFGAGKLPSITDDLAKGVRSFKAGLKDEQAGLSGSDPAGDRIAKQ